MNLTTQKRNQRRLEAKRGPWTSAPPPPVPTGPAVDRSVAARSVRVGKVYGHGDTAVLALDDVSVEFGTGRFTAIMGPSGSGKSTLMHCLAGLDTLTSGSVYIGDTDLGELNDRQLTRLRRDRIGFIFQAFNLVPTLTALENITLPARSPVASPTRPGSTTSSTPSVCGDRLEHRPSELSGGQQQRVAVARALAVTAARSSSPTSRPATSTPAPAPRSSTFMRTAVRELGQTIVMVTHDPVAAAYADRVVFLADGRIVDEIHEPTAD